MSRLRFAISIACIATVTMLIVWNADADGFLKGIRGISSWTLVAVLAALIANALAASFRLKVIAADIGHPINFQQAMAAVGGGSLAGAAFFQLAGQLMARSVIMGRAGIPFASVAIITTYERLIAAIVSALFALAGACFIFGRVYLDQKTGGDELIKITCGLILAAAAGFVVGHGKMSAASIAPVMTQALVKRFLRLIAMSLLVQFPMMLAYVLVAHTLSTNISVFNIVAASAVVMFAASVPVSLAGWGVREMSAIFALGTIGMDMNNALITAVTVGICSMLAMAMITATSLASWRRIQIIPKKTQSAINFTRVLAWALPIATATLVLFQLYVPIASGTLLNVNLADPLVPLGGTLFILQTVQRGHPPRWRWPYVNVSVAAATFALTISLLIGAARYGWMEWAIVNRFFGWFILLAFGMTGALIVQEGGNRGLRILLLTFAGSTAAVALLDLSFLALNSAGLGLSLPVSRQLEGFSQNHNFFAFQLLMALNATIIAARVPRTRIALLSILLAGVWFSGSRSAWLTLPVVLATFLYLHLRTFRLRDLIAAPIGALLIIGLVILLTPAGQLPTTMPEIWISPANHNERLLTIFGGLSLFAEYPLFGAGLGAFRSQLIMSTSGLPLLIHSTVVWLLAELGLVGLLVFLIPALTLLYSLLRYAKLDSGARLIVLNFAVFAVMSAPADMLYQRTFWLLIGAGLAVAIRPKADNPNQNSVF